MAFFRKISKKKLYNLLMLSVLGVSGEQPRAEELEGNRHFRYSDYHIKPVFFCWIICALMPCKLCKLNCFSINYLTAQISSGEFSTFNNVGRCQKMFYFLHQSEIKEILVLFLKKMYGFIVF